MDVSGVSLWNDLVKRYTDGSNHPKRVYTGSYNGPYPPAPREEETMIVERIWTGNAYRNYNYLIACPESGEALAIDPLDHEKCFQGAKDAGWKITQILNTHEHGDHTGGNGPLVKKTGARILAHRDAKNKIPDMSVGLGAGDVVKVGRTVELEALDTPGHTMSHVCLLSHTDQPALFCGDTLFNAGAGNCTTAAIRPSSTRRSPSSSPGCHRRP